MSAAAVWVPGKLVRPAFEVNLTVATAIQISQTKLAILTFPLHNLQACFPSAVWTSFKWNKEHLDFMHQTVSARLQVFAGEPV